MRQLLIALAQLSVALPVAFVFAAAPEKPVPVHGQGCVAAGVEARCLVVRDLKTGKLYNLTFRGLQPAIGEGIEFEGLPHEGSTTCIQGVALDVTGWARKDTLKCKPGGTHKN
jgi:hypothetical protein